MSKDSKLLKKALKKNGLTLLAFVNHHELDVDHFKAVYKGDEHLSEEEITFLNNLIPEKKTRVIQREIYKKYTPKTLVGVFSTKPLLGMRQSFFKDIGFAIHTFFAQYKKPFFSYVSFLFLTFILAFFVDQFATETLMYSAIGPLTLLGILYFTLKEYQIPVFKMIKGVVYGGLLSILLVVFIREFTGYPEGLLGNFLTAFIEEAMKVVVVIFLFRKLPIHTVKTGLIIGFTVGAGFDIFETADYGFMTFLENFEYGDLYGVLTTRNIFAIVGIGHHYWTALIIAAMVYTKKTTILKFKHLLNGVSLTMFTMVVALHAFWNFTDTLFANDLAFLGGLIMILVIMISTLLFIKLYQVSYYEESFNTHQVKL
ncbi:MAG: PrsW family glutamic-type intramembrane protease [Candidatus Izemoplasmataceae bacterium]